MIGNGTQQAQTIQDSDAVGRWGVFRSSDLEARYRQQQAGYDTFQFKVFLAIIVSASLALTFSDYRLFGFSGLFWRLIALRVSFAVVSAGTIFVLQRSQS